MDIGWRAFHLTLLLIVASIWIAARAADSAEANRIAGMAQLSQAQDNAVLIADFVATSPVSLDAFHDYSTRFQLPLAKIYTQSPPAQSSQSSSASESTGEWVGQKDERWERTICKLRIAAQIDWEVDMPASAILVRSWSVIAPATKLRELVGSGVLGQFQRVKSLSAQEHAYEVEEASKYHFHDFRFVPEHFPIPSGCNAYARNVKGLRAIVPGRSMGESRGPSETKDVLKRMAEDMPKQGVLLSLHTAQPTSVRELAKLVSTYDVSLLRLSGPLLDTLEFSSTGPRNQNQLDRAACIMRSILGPAGLGDERSADEYLGLKRNWRFFVSIYLTANEAKRLVDHVPEPFTEALLSDIFSSGALELEHQKFETGFSQMWLTSRSSTIPSGCERFIGYPN